MSIKIQVKPNDEAAADFINEKPVIATIGAWKNLPTLFSVSDLEAMLNTGEIHEIALRSPSLVSTFPLSVNNNNVLLSAFCYIPYLTQEGLTQQVLQWVNTSEGEVSFQAFELSPSGSITDITSRYVSLQGSFIRVDRTNIEVIYEEE